MRSLSRTLLLVVALLAIGLPAQAAETSNSEFVIIRADDTVEDDLYAGAIKVTIEGTLDGDLIAFAAEEIVVNGEVTGSIFGATQTMEINGTVGGSVRTTAPNLKVRGAVGRDVVASSWSVLLDTDSVVEGDVIVWAMDVQALGTVEGDLGGVMRSLEVAGSVGGDIDVTVSSVAVVDDLTVGGDFGYRSNAEAEGLENATVDGAVVHKQPLPPNIRVRALGLVGRFFVVVFLTLIAMTVVWGWPDRTERSADKVLGSTVRSWGVGALVLSVPLILAGIAALVLGLAPASASLPLLAVLAPLVIASLGVAGALAVVAGIPTAAALGKTMFRKLSLHGAVLAGSAIVGLVWLLPVIGWAVPLLVLPSGLGGWILGRKQTDEVAVTDVESTDSAPVLDQS